MRRPLEPLTRRQVIAGGLGATLSVYAAKAMPFARMLEAAEAQAAAAPNAPVLVSVFLPGGCDLLDTLVPVSQFGRYADLRKAGRITEPLSLGSSGLGLHPALASGARGGIKGLFDAGKIGFLPGIDYGNPDLSHFHSRHFWETGLITEQDAPGWLGRWLEPRGVRIVYAVFDGQLVVSTSPQGIRAVKDRSDSLADTEAFRGATAGLPSKVTALGFLDFTRLLQLGEQTGLRDNQRYLAIREDLRKVRAVGVATQAGANVSTAEFHVQIP